ncbi:retrovirus-related pol polyprotein from transposon TNT 1-94 [Tanacetum coccineum]
MLVDKTNLMDFHMLGVGLEPDEWIKDSGCSKHMTGNRKLFSTYKISMCEITKDGKVIGRDIRKKGLYVMKLGNKPKDKICLATIDENSTLWHRRLGHANMRLIQSLASKELVRNLPKLKFDQHFCDACKIGKQANVSHKAKNIDLPLVDNDLDEEEAIRENKKKNIENVVEDETLEIDEIVNIKEFRNHPIENVIGNLNQRTLRSQAQNQSNFYCFISTIEPKNVNEALGDESWIVVM